MPHRDLDRPNRRGDASKPNLTKVTFPDRRPTEPPRLAASTARQSAAALLFGRIRGARIDRRIHPVLITLVVAATTGRILVTRAGSRY
ncbi:hypothetical protein CKW46_22400 [Mycobacterium liflandii]|nr:hypothetical protein MMMB2_2339 [Mycobacterium marinum MB2]ULL11669.1 hypothetical protein CKW46_22400 [Mycobacterium liflandii]